MPFPRSRVFLPALALLMAAGAQAAVPQTSPRILAAADRVAELESRRAELGLDARHTFKVTHVDTLEGFTHTRVQQYYQGIPVWGGEAILRQDRTGQDLPMISRLKRDIELSTDAALPAAEALAIAHADLAPKGSYARTPKVELVVYPVYQEVEAPARGRAAGAEPRAEDFHRELLRYELAYHVHAELENALDGARSMDYLIHAHTGAVLEKWSSLERIGPVKGTGHSQFSGTVPLNTFDLGAGQFVLFDSTRGTGGDYGANVTLNFKNGYAGDGKTNPSAFVDADNVWGNGSNYLTFGSAKPSTTGATGETAAVDAHFGLQSTWDFYKQVFRRNGVDGDGTATYNRVHYLPPDSNGNIPFGLNNAFWNDSCFCMSYGDGDGLTTNSFTAIDVAGHEMSHGVCSSMAGLNYSNEAGGLNESNSDIFGTMVEFYTRQGVADGRIRNVGGNWLLGEQIRKSGTPLRFMYKPSLDGRSPDAWYSGIGTDPKLATTDNPSGGDPHFVSGPMNRFFYFLSQGASPRSGDVTFSKFLTPGLGIVGLGNDKAARIWYFALSLLGSNATYVEAMNACVTAATLLYPLEPQTVDTVRAAATAINVYSTFSGATFTWESGNNTNLLAPDPISSHGGVLAGTIANGFGDRYYSVRLGAGKSVKATLVSPSDSTYYLFVYDANGVMVGHVMNPNGDFQIHTLKNTGTTTATFYYRIHPAYQGTATPRAYYTLQVNFL